ncbi:MAG: ribbon-helix-helix domain-containing protein [Chloroflexota bacterium]
MTIVQIELPEKTAQELDALVKKGWFTDRAEAIRLALAEFLGRNRLELMERFQEEDIRWALDQSKTDDHT